ncbi:MAG: hypothetical protein QNK22_07970 [Xanthomonadales bacterium]|nr:hypothetical protein [Xanthomonadales bacterium]
MGIFITCLKEGLLVRENAIRMRFILMGLWATGAIDLQRYAIVPPKRWSD